MKLTSRLTSFACVAILLVVASCKKEDEPKPSKTELLTAKSWTMTTYLINGADLTDSYIPKCAKDDSLKFGKDGKVTTDNGVEKCDPSEAQTENSGTWTFDSNETKLKLTTVKNNIELYTIEELTATMLKLSGAHTEEINGTTVTAKLVVTLTGK